MFIRLWITLPTETPSKEKKFKLDHTTGWQLNFDWSEKPDGMFRLRPGSEEKGNREERSENQAEEQWESGQKGTPWYNGTKDRKEVSGFKSRHQVINYTAVTEKGRSWKTGARPEDTNQSKIYAFFFFWAGRGGTGSCALPLPRFQSCSCLYSQKH